jgi:acyl-coenzyme A synthetase/AMP-(fatty) acid ligase
MPSVWNSGLSQNPTPLPKVYKMPRLIQFVADLPKTSTGKIMRRELRKLDT